MVFYIFTFLYRYIACTRQGLHFPLSYRTIWYCNKRLKFVFGEKLRPGEKVTVSTSWDKNIYTVQTPTDGHWEVKIKTPGVMDNQTLTVKGENTITIHNILIGEVWLCTGQSNMEFPVARDPNGKMEDRYTE